MAKKDKSIKRIAMLGQKTVPALDSSRGGIEVVVEELAPRLVDLGCEVTCYNRSGCYNGDVSEYRGVRLKRVFTIKRKGLAAATSSFFATLKAAFGNYDVIHFHAEGTCFWMWIPKLFGKKCVVTIHGIDHKREKWLGGFGSYYIRHAEKAAVKHANDIIVLSKNMQDYFWKSYQRKTIVIPNGAKKPQKRECHEIRAKFGLEKDSYILYLGRIVPEKGLKYLIAAYRKLNTDKKLVIAGEASNMDRFESKLRRQADERVVFTGFVNGIILEELYTNAYMFVLPSDLEGMPLSLLEAMSYGNCCLVSDIEECKEVVEDKAVVFQRGEVEELRIKMQNLCDNPEIVQQYKREAADFICKKYNWDVVAEKTMAVYKKCVD